MASKRAIRRRQRRQLKLELVCDLPEPDDGSDPEETEEAHLAYGFWIDGTCYGSCCYYDGYDYDDQPSCAYCGDHYCDRPYCDLQGGQLRDDVIARCVDCGRYSTLRSQVWVLGGKVMTLLCERPSRHEDGRCAGTLVVETDEVMAGAMLAAYALGGLEAL